MPTYPPDPPPGWSNVRPPAKDSGLASDRPTPATFGEGWWLNTDTGAEDYSNGQTWFPGINRSGGLISVDANGDLLITLP